jgi:hypothetical protein
MHIITPDRCAEIALAGLDAGLFWIPTHRHLSDDMAPRHAGVAQAVRVLGLYSALPPGRPVQLLPLVGLMPPIVSPPSTMNSLPVE